MYFIYTLILTVGLALAAPYYLVFRRSRDWQLAQRFGKLDLPRLQRSIWVHAVSVGEVKSVRSLLEKLRTTYPDRSIVVSTVTIAGQQLAKSFSDVVDHVFYFPLDFPWTVRRTLDHIDPEFVVVAETEIWPNFLRACSRRGVKV